MPWSVPYSARLEEEEKLVTAEGLYRKALALDETFKEAEEALKKLQVHIQVSHSTPLTGFGFGCMSPHV